jgi:hypothetical protein
MRNIKFCQRCENPYPHYCFLWGDFESPICQICLLTMNNVEFREFLKYLEYLERNKKRNG